ncbi:hypothetical protein RHMOL_Rhmol01G0239700 [Rhododendron molle]|uniref:Uncharacterized protein n=1 Tax=Rhododendron molle TaxID=49168 RepID=A0ACC0Q5D0_RHOML|nr:hypothetical protein RHMOL_Rhmol01G0239700 [Rhododendron molle]
MPPPHSQKTLEHFLGKVSYLQRFIPAVVEIAARFADLLKGNARFEWKQEHQQAFKRIKVALTSLVIVKSLIIYLTSTLRSIGALLVQEIDGTEHRVKYISKKTVLPAELSVSSARMILVMESSAEGKRADLEALEETRVTATLAHEKY